MCQCVYECVRVWAYACVVQSSGQSSPSRLLLTGLSLDPGMVCCQCVSLLWHGPGHRVASENTVGIHEITRLLGQARTWLPGQPQHGELRAAWAPLRSWEVWQEFLWELAWGGTRQFLLSPSWKEGTQSMGRGWVRQMSALARSVHA